MASPLAQAPLFDVPREPEAILVLSPRWHSRWRLVLKRSFDVLVSALMLILLAPLFLIIAIAIKLDCPGPVFYDWKVVGQGGRKFVGYKFRSMVANAEALRQSLAERNEMSGPVFKLTNDPRITRVGRWLRRYSIDEFPQLYSVFKGDMSLVGPRPPLVTEYERFTEFQKQKLAVTPGMTCLWQVNGRNDIRDFDEWVKLDVEYIRRWSLILDFQILFRTASAVFTGTGK